MYDLFRRKIDYMRLSVTDRCNLRCIYCMPESGVRAKMHEELLSYEEIERFAGAAVKAGLTKIRLTGGEPLVRKDIVSLVEMLDNISGLDDIALTTNGLLLPDYGKALKNAGLKRVNLSLDSLNPATYKKLTRGGDVKNALYGLLTAIELRLEPVKVNAVLIKGVNDDPKDFIELIYNYPVHVRFIELMPVGMSNKESYLSIAEFKKKLAAFGKIEQIEGKAPRGAGPASYVTFRGALGTIGFIGAISDHFCDRCNRIRLTPDGKLRPCLFSDTEFDIRKLLRANVNEEELVAFIRYAIGKKPERYTADKKECMGRTMSQIGG